MSKNIANGSIRSRIVFLFSKIKTLNNNAALIPVRATSKKLSKSLWL